MNILKRVNQNNIKKKKQIGCYKYFFKILDGRVDKKAIKLIK
jgi:hypothetical protein